MKKTINRFSIAIICLVLSLMVLVAFSYAWYQNREAKIPEITGSVSLMKNYFERGTGTAEDPFIIHTRDHFYNLAWLQDLGYFNNSTYYFAFCQEGDENCIAEGDDTGIPNNELDMGGDILPPIGTDIYPFKGQIAGKNVKVKNYKVSTGATVSNVGVSKNNIGVFGVLDSSALVHDLYFEDVTLQMPSSVKEEVAAGVNTGYLVGHIVGDYTNYKNEPNITNASPLYNVYINDVTLVGGAGSKSSYGLFGMVDEIDGKVRSIEDIYRNLVQASQGDSGFGNTIDFGKLYDRLSLMLANPADVYNVGGTSKSGSAISIGSPQENPTYIPISIKNPINNAYYSAEGKINGELTTSGNAGYLVGYSTASDFRVDRNSITASGTNLGNIKNSLNGKASYKENEFCMYTMLPPNKNSPVIAKIEDDKYNASGTVTQLSGTVTIKPKEYGYVQYDAVREKMESILGDGSLDSLAFMATKQENSVGYVDATNVKLSGKTYGSYQFLQYGINFSTLTSGTVAAVCRSTYTNGNSAVAMATLIHIIRDGNNKITARKIISKVEKDKQGKIRYTYSYPTAGEQYSENGFQASTATVCYDASWWEYKQTIEQTYALYYLEIPLMAGDYAFTRLGKDSSPHCFSFCYLDLGITGNNSMEEVPIVEDAPLFTQTDYLSSGTSNRAQLLLSYTVPEDATDDNFSINVNSSVTDGTTTYNISVKNTTENTVQLVVLLCDNDDNHDNAYPYKYTLSLNGNTPKEYYSTSGIFEGGSGGEFFSKVEIAGTAAASQHIENGTDSRIVEILIPEEAITEEDSTEEEEDIEPYSEEEILDPYES